MRDEIKEAIEELDESVAAGWVTNGGRVLSATRAVRDLLVQVEVEREKAEACLAEMTPALEYAENERARLTKAEGQALARGDRLVIRVAALEAVVEAARKCCHLDSTGYYGRSEEALKRAILAIDAERPQCGKCKIPRARCHCTKPDNERRDGGCSMCGKTGCSPKEHAGWDPKVTP